MIGQINDLYSHHCEDCGGFVENLADDNENESWDDIYRQIAEDILSGKDYKINRDLQYKTAERLIKAVNKGFAFSGNNMEDRTLLSNKLKQNIYLFSAAKSATQMIYYRDMMLGDDGAILGKESYINKIANTGEIFNKKHLATEYESAYYSTIMADKWDRMSEDEILEYSTAGDKYVRDSHKLLDKFTAPKTDPFWKTNYPPNGWNCKCIVVPGKDRPVSERQQERYDAGKNSLKQENEKTPFYNNVGISAQIFDEKKHPYFNNLTKEDFKKESASLAKSNKFEKFIPEKISVYEEKLNILIKKEFFKHLNKETLLYFENPKTNLNSGTGAYYSPVHNFVKIPIDNRRRNSKWYAEAVVYHEFGHASDSQNQLKFTKTVKDIMDKNRTVFSADNDKIFKKSHKRLFAFYNYGFKKNNYDIIEKAAAGLDTLMSLNPKFGYGHSKNYFSLEGKKEAEFIAHSFENKYAGNEIFKRVMPDLYEQMIKMVDDFKK